MNPSKLLLILMSAVIVSVGVTSLVYSFFYVVDLQERPMKLLVADFVGLDTSKGNLSFGAASPGNSAQRLFSVANLYDRPVRVRITLSGELAAWVSLTDSNFVLADKESKSITATAVVPEDAIENRTYRGTMRVIWTKVW